jgi:hypothetical protein
MLLVSCSKGRIEEEPTIEPTKTIVTETNSLRFSAPICEYYFNNARVAEDTYSLEDTTLNLIIQKVSDEKIIFFSYSSLAAYLQKGTELGLNLQKVLEIENDLQSYAQSIGAIDLYDNTGVIDARYTAFEEKYINDIPNYKEGQNKGILAGTWFDKSSPNTTPRTLYPGISAFMWFGAWQKKVSCFAPMFLYGKDVIYKETLFRKRMVTLIGWGTGTISFTGPLAFIDNKARSWLAYGL